MVNPDDANLTSVQAVDTGTDFTANTVAKGGTFDVIAQVEIGSNLSEIADELTVTVGVHNAMRGTATAKTASVAHKNGSANVIVPVKLSIDQLPPGTEAGDLLRLEATVFVDAGVRSDYSSGRAEPPIVVTNS